MRKSLVLIIALITVVAAAACGCSDNNSEETSAETAVVHITSKPTTASTSESVKITEEAVKQINKNNSKSNATEPTEAATKKAKKKKSSKLPTQGQTQPNTYVTVTTAPNGSFSASDLQFVYEGAYIELNDDIEDAIAIIGDDNSVSELSKTKTEYEYDALTIVTYTSKGNERVEQITVTSDKIPTQKDAKIGMYATQLRTIYGEPAKKSDTSYTYSKGNKSLVFNYENNIVVSYTYTLNL